MNSTWGKVTARVLLARLLLSSVLVLAAVRVCAAEDSMPRPPELERDVQFWVRVYTEVDTNGGFLHDVVIRFADKSSDVPPVIASAEAPTSVTAAPPAGGAAPSAPARGRESPLAPCGGNSPG